SNELVTRFRWPPILTLLSTILSKVVLEPKGVVILIGLGKLDAFAINSRQTENEAIISHRTFQGGRYEQARLYSSHHLEKCGSHVAFLRLDVWTGVFGVKPSRSTKNDWQAVSL